MSNAVTYIHLLVVQGSMPGVWQLLEVEVVAISASRHGCEGLLPYGSSSMAVLFVFRVLRGTSRGVLYIDCTGSAMIRNGINLSCDLSFSGHRITDGRYSSHNFIIFHISFSSNWLGAQPE